MRKAKHILTAIKAVSRTNVLLILYTITTKSKDIYCHDPGSCDPVFELSYIFIAYGLCLSSAHSISPRLAVQ